MKNSLTIEEIERVAQYIQKEETESLYSICTKIGAKNKNLDNIESMSYFIVEKIEENEELLELFKNKISEKAILKVLLPYFKNVENIRHFMDNKEKYNIVNVDIKKMESNLSKKYSDKAENAQKKRDKFWNKYGLILCVFVEILLLVFTIDEMKPYLETNVIKTANITEAVVLKVNKTFSGAVIPTTSVDLDYEYVIEDTKYTKNKEHVLVLGVKEAEKFEVGNKIQIYYDKENLEDSNVYVFNKLVMFWLIIGNLLFIIGIIKESKRRIEKQRSKF